MGCEWNRYNNLDFNRYIAGTTTQGAWDNYYTLTVTNDNPDEYRLIGNQAGWDIDSGVDVLLTDNFAVKNWYTSLNDDTFIWVFNNSSGSQMWSYNRTDISTDLKYWGFFTDFTRTANKFYDIRIYDSFERSIWWYLQSCRRIVIKCL